jgi:hypothetical protein
MKTAACTAMHCTAQAAKISMKRIEKQRHDIFLGKIPVNGRE